MPDKPKKILGIEGLSKYLEVSKSTLYKLAQEGKLPGQKVGKHWRFRQETIDKWLDSGSETDGGGPEGSGDEKDDQ
jgi:excisionase family DNA binding protein